MNNKVLFSDCSITYGTYTHILRITYVPYFAEM